MSPTEPDSPDTAAEPVDALAESFVAACRRGERPSIDAYADAHPELAEEIRDLFPLLASMEDLRQETTPPASGTLGDYELVREIGRGGMGVVYEAVQRPLGRRVALKVLPPSATLDPRYLERFRMEAQAAGRLQHPHIVPVIGAGEHDGVHYYTMQFIEGRGLDEVVRASTNGERPGTTEAARMLLAAAEGVAAAHAQGVLHRDIKPSNLLLDADGKIWIADFGLCKDVDSGDLTRSGDVLGTLRYLPPERFRGESDVQGDVYGLGITLYELLTGSPAYEDEDRVAVMGKVLKEDPPRPRAVDSRIPADLEAIVRKAMARDRRQRYATADALASDLRAFLDGRPVTARAPTFGYQLRSYVRRHRPLAITVCLAVLALIGSTVLYVQSLRDKEEDARFQSYVANVAAAEAAVRTRDPAGARRLLDAAPAEFRNWEWRYLDSSIYGSLRVLDDDAWVRTLAVSADGRRIALGQGTRSNVFDDASGELVDHIEHGTWVRHLRWSPAGGLLAVTTQNGVELWRWPEKTLVRTWDDAGDARMLEFSADGRFLAAGGHDGYLRVWHVDSGALYRRLPMGGRVRSLAFHPQALRICVGTRDGRAQLFDLASRQRVWARKVTKRGLLSMCFVGPDHLATASEVAHARVWSAWTGEPERVLSRFIQGGVTAVCAPPDGSALVVVSGGDLQVWDTDTWTHRLTWQARAIAQGAVVHPDGTRVITPTQTGVSEWGIDVAHPETLEGHMDDVGAVSVAPSGAYFVSGGRGGVLRVWDAATHEQRRVWIGNRWSVGEIDIAPDSRLVASGDAMGDVLVWNAETDERVHLLEGHDTRIGGLAFAPDGKRLLSGDASGRLCVWDVASGRRLRELKAGDTGIEALAFSPDGALLAVGLGSGNLPLLDGETLEARGRLEGHTGIVYGLAFRHDGAQLASAAHDETMRLWDVARRKPLGRFRAQAEGGGSDPLLCVTFSPDGSRIATGAMDGRVRLWDPQRGRLVATLGFNEAYYYDVAFTVDGERLLIATGGAQVRVWDTRPLGQRVARALERSGVRRRARALVDAAAATEPRHDVVVAHFRGRTDLDADLREACLREAHRRRGSIEGLVQRMWQALIPPELDKRERWVARGIAADLERAAGHRNYEDRRRATLWGALTCRCGDYALAIRRLERSRVYNGEASPDLLAVDLAFLTIAYAGAERVGEATAALQQLDQLFEHEPKAATPRNKAFRAEAAAALAKATR